MVTKLNDNLPIGIYHTLDNIDNFRMRIRIKKSSNVSVPLCEVSDTPHKSQEYELMQLHSREQKSYIEHTFSWQEKIEKGENQGASIEESENHIALFSYVSTELSSQDYEDKIWLTIRRLKTENTASTVGKAAFSSDEIKTFQKNFFLKELIQVTSRKTPSYVAGQSMAIMAVLDANDNLEAEEVQLCYITYDSKGVLIMVPDFNNSPYYIQSNKSENYEFILEHCSNSIKSSDAELEKTFLKKVHEHHATTISNIVGSDFEIPKNNIKVYHILCDLVSAENFDASNLFIRFTFELPKGASTADTSSLHGLTNFCKAKKKSNDNGTIAHFGLPINLQFEAGETETLKNVRLLIEVSSLDFWNICRSEGYGFCAVPTTPGYQSTHIKTWKLLPQSILERLRHFFIGKSSYVDDLSYIRIPVLSQDSQLSKYGVKTEISGSVFIKFQIIVQSS